jgi:hypothetical protein
MEDGRAPGLLEKDADVLFALIDKDGNGEISKEEFSEHLKACGYEDDRINKVFTSIDVSADGSLSGDEFRAAWIKHPTMRTAPGLGAALKEKLNSDADTLFALLDVDSDGDITQVCAYPCRAELESAVVTRAFEHSSQVSAPLLIRARVRCAWCGRTSSRNTCSRAATHGTSSPRRSSKRSTLMNLVRST